MWATPTIGGCPKTLAHDQLRATPIQVERRMSAKDAK